MRAAAIVALLAFPGALEAAPADPIDAALIGSFLAGGLLATLIPIERGEPWRTLELDDPHQISSGARHASDVSLLVTVLVPTVFVINESLDAEDHRPVVLYAEALAGTFLATQLTKYLVGRPRPYVGLEDRHARAYAASRGDDAYLSFFSGHSALAFAAAVGGTTVFSSRVTNENTRAAFWGIELTAAAATATLRVIAGQHHYSDVLVGALVGSTIGILVPALHGELRGYAPGGLELVGMGAGLLIGAVVPHLLPFERGLSDYEVEVLVLPTDSGASLLLGGRF